MAICGHGWTVSLLGAIALPALASEPEFLRNWNKIADGVYEQADVGGVSTRLAFGSGGAAFERARLSKEIDERVAAASKRGGSEEDVQSIAALQEALANVPLSAAASVRPASSTTGLVCSRFAYAFDSSFVAGKGGVDALSRATIDLAQPGPPVAVTVQSLYADATVTPTGKPAITVVKSTNAANMLVAAIADWAPADTAYGGGLTNIGSASCTGQTNASIQISTSSPCSGAAGFVSLSKSYSSCVTSP